MPPQRIATTLALCVLSSACGGLTPLNPSYIAPRDAGDLPTLPAAASRNAVQRVEEGGGGGGSQCLETATEICVTIVLRSPSAILEGNGKSPYDPSASPLNFSVIGGLDVHPVINDTPAGAVVGRFTSGAVRLSVLNGSMTFSVVLNGPFDNNQSFLASGTGPAVQSQTCYVAPGATIGALSIRTTSTLDLPYLGRSEIVVSRAARTQCAA